MLYLRKSTNQEEICVFGYALWNMYKCIYIYLSYSMFHGLHTASILDYHNDTSDCFRNSHVETNVEALSINGSILHKRNLHYKFGQQAMPTEGASTAVFCSDQEFNSSCPIFLCFILYLGVVSELWIGFLSKETNLEEEIRECAQHAPPTNKYSLIIHPPGGQIKPPEKCDVDIWFSAPMVSLCGSLLLCSLIQALPKQPQIYIFQPSKKTLISIPWSRNYAETVIISIWKLKFVLCC